MDSSSYGAHADMLGARYGVRAAEDGHLTLLRAHGTFEVACQEWLLLAAAVATQGTVQGPCIETEPCVDYLHDGALIIKNLGPTVGQ
jgi:hypothetical protein